MWGKRRGILQGVIMNIFYILHRRMPGIILVAAVAAVVYVPLSAAQTVWDVPTGAPASRVPSPAPPETVPTESPDAILPESPTPTDPPAATAPERDSTPPVGTEEPPRTDTPTESSVMTAPPAPTGVKTVAGDGQAIVFWNNPGDARITSYEYQMKTGTGTYGNWTPISGSSAATTHHTVPALTNTTMYRFKIRAKAGSTAGTASSEVAVTPAADLAAPVLGDITAIITGIRDRITLSVPITDPNPPTTAPTVTMRLGSSTAERMPTAVTRTLTTHSAGTKIAVPGPFANEEYGQVDITLSVTHISGNRWRASVIYSATLENIYVYGGNSVTHGANLCTGGTLIASAGRGSTSVTFTTAEPSVVVCLVDSQYDESSDIYDTQHIGEQAFGLQDGYTAVTTYAYTYPLTPGDTGTPRYRVTGLADTAATPNRVTDQTSFTQVPTVTVDYDADDDNLIDITTLAQLDAIRHDLDGNGVPSSGGSAAYNAAFPTPASGLGCRSTCVGYELMNNLDFDTDGDGTADGGDAYWNGGAGWIPIGSDATGSRFTGTFNGNGFVLRHLHINRPAYANRSGTGLFGAIESDAVIENVALRDVAISGGEQVGALVGIARGGTCRIRTSYSTGSVGGWQNVGGLVGAVTADCGVLASYTTATVRSTQATGNNFGGLIGYILNNIPLSGSYAVNAFAVQNAASRSVNGLIGAHHTFTGGTTGYWDTTVSGLTRGGTGFGTGKTTVQLRSPISYTSTAGNGATAIYDTWDDTDLDGDGDNDSPWDFGTADQYPVLVIGGHRAETQRTAVSELIAVPGTARATLSWKSDSHNSVTGWEYAYKAESAGAWGAWTAVPGATGATRSYAVTSLVNGTVYLFKVRPVAGGYGSESGEAVATPNAGIAATDYDTDTDNLIDITTLAQLDAVRYDLDGNGVPDNGTTTAQKKAYAAAFPTSRTGFFCTACAGYELMNDLDFDTDGDGSAGTGAVTNPTGDSDDGYYNGGKGWIPIGTDGADSAAYAGIFDGNGNIIENLFIRRIQQTDDGNAGLFAIVGPTAEVRNLGLRNILVRTHRNAGGIAGENYGTIRNSFVTGDNFGYVAGLMTADNFGTVDSSYTVGTVGSGGANAVAGGIAGSRSLGAIGIINNSYTVTTVTAVGSHSSAHGIAARGMKTGSYFDKTVFGSGTGATARTTAQLRTPVNYAGIYAGWDDTDLDDDGTNDSPWDFGTAGQYPVLVTGGHRAETQRAVVSELIATPDDTRATLTWRSDASSATGWEYTYKTAGAGAWGAWTAIPGATAATRSYAVPSLVNGTTYLFKVRPSGVPAGFGSESTEAVVVPGTGIAATNFDSDTDNLIDITAPAQLNAIRYDLNGDGIPDDGIATADKVAYYDAFRTSRPGFFCTDCDGYELMNTINLDTDRDGSADSGDDYWNAAAGWVPIAGFAATLNGNGFKVDNLFINRSGSNNQGLFGTAVNGAVISAVGIRDAEITGQHGVGALVGVMRPGAAVNTSYSTGAVIGQWATGGLVGYNEGGTVEASYSGATVTTSSNTVGGLVGYNQLSGASVTNSYAYGRVSGTSTNIGGLVGLNRDGATITDSYWDSTVTPASGGNTAGATGKTTMQLQSPTAYTSTAGNGMTAIYDSWDDRDIDGDGTNDAPWHFGAAMNYPMLEIFQKFSLDLDDSGTYEPNRDAILLYLYTNQGSSSTELTAFTVDGQQGTVADAIGMITMVMDEPDTLLDIDGNGSFTPGTDGIIPYLHSGQGYDATSLSTFTHNRQQTTAAGAIERIRGALTPNWP